MNTEWSVTDVTAVESSDRANIAILGILLAVCFWTIQAVFVVGEQRCHVGTPS